VGWENPGAGWYEINVDQSTIKIADPASITMPYDDGFIYGAYVDTSLTVTGTVKTKATMLAVRAGYNYTGSVCPASATLASTFGDPPAAHDANGLSQGFGGFGSADQIYVVDPLGVLRIYYYDTYGQFQPDPMPVGWENPGAGWYEINVDQTTTKISPTAVPMSSGYIFGAYTSGNVLSNVPSSYSGL